MNAGTRKVVVEIFPDGSSKIDAQNFQGQACSLATKDLELALVGNGGDIDKKPKPDFYQSVGQSQSIRG